MSSIDTINQFEKAGFTKKQAELQVRTMDDLKKSLATTNDIEFLLKDIDRKLEPIKRDISTLRHEMNYRFDTMDAKFETKLNAMDTKFNGRLEVMNAKIDSLDTMFETKFSALDTRFDLLTVKIDNGHFKNSIYTASVFLIMLGLAKY
ncbi:MAG: hypothetical protein KDD37_10970, partial [Bdellovibrionales bacterium]|nr:hypothetical protein [Bdellovibrionales bacterium]